MTRVKTRIATDGWVLQADTDDPDVDPRSLAGPVTAAWGPIDVLPPVAAPSAIAFTIFDDGSNPFGILDVIEGEPIMCRIDDQDRGTPLVSFQGRVADVAAVPRAGGGVLINVVATDRLADLAAIGCKRRVRGSQYTVTGVNGLFLAYDAIAEAAGITFDYHVHETNSTPLWRDTRDAALNNVSVLDALNRYVAHDVRGAGKISRYLGFEIDPVASDPLTDVTYSLREYDPQGSANTLAGALALDYAGGLYSLVANPDYYADGGSAVVVTADNVAFDGIEWRKSRRFSINTVDVNGVFTADTLYPVHKGAFAGASGSTAGTSISPNLSGQASLPDDVADGDWAYCFIYAATGSIADPITPPAGWKQIGSISPAQSSSTVRGWAFKKRLTSADASSVPVWTISNASRWFMCGGVVRNAGEPIVSGSAGTNTTAWVNNNAVSSTSGAFAAAVGSGDRSLAVLSIGARWGTATTAGPPPFGSPGSLYTEQVNAQDPTAGASNRMGAAVFTAKLASDGDVVSPTTTLAAAGNNGIAFSIVFPLLVEADTVRRDFSSLVADYGRNTRSISSPLWYIDDAKALGDVLLGDLDEISTGYGLDNAVIAWETLSDDAAEIIASLLWPRDDVQAYGMPVAIVDVPDQWNLANAPAVFGRIMGATITAEGAKIRVALSIRNVSPVSSAGITYDDAGTHAPTWTYDNTDPAMTIEQLALVKD